MHIPVSHSWCSGLDSRGLRFDPDLYSGSSVTDHIFFKGPFCIKRPVVRELVTTARIFSPYEMCAVLAGSQRNLVTEWHLVKNVHDDPEHFYQMDPAEQIQAFKHIAAKDLEVCGIFHSHTRTDAKPSQADIDYAAYWNLFYVILSLDPRELTAWSMDFTGKRDKGDEVWEHRIFVEPYKPGLDYCLSHGRYEDSIGAYRICGECNHKFMSELALIEGWNKFIRWQIKTFPETERDLLLSLASTSRDVSFCPYCGREW